MSKFESSGEDDAYIDRNLAVQLLAVVLHNAGCRVGWLADDPNKTDGWEVLMMELPDDQQISYHIPSSEKIADLPDFYGWDGHSLGEKRARIISFCNHASSYVP